MSDTVFALLIQRIQAKCQQERWYGPSLFGPPWHQIAESDPRRTTFAEPPATPEQIALTQTLVGFALPPLLALLYTQVANGGFGPGCGLRGSVGGYQWDEQTIVDAYQHIRMTQVVDLAGQRVQWPSSLLPLCDLGCDQEACLDCQSGCIIIVAPTQRGQRIEPKMRLATPSLQAWLDAWIQDTSLTHTQ